MALPSAQGGYRYGGFGMRYEPAIRNVPYDGRFTFARLKFTGNDNTPTSSYYYRGMPAWAHGYSDAEFNLMKILDSISAVHPRLDGSNVFALDDPELFKFPLAYMTEAGFLTLTDKEAAGFRAYLQKGGFVIFDDFRPPPRGGGGWEEFADGMKRVLPDAQIVDMAANDPIFHCFFDIDALTIIPQYYDAGRPELRGIYEDNDHNKRLMAIINFNTDVSEFWEFSSTGTAPVDESNEAYELGVNYVIYGLTH